MLGETQNLFPLASAALSTGGRAKSDFLALRLAPLKHRVHMRPMGSAMFSGQAWDAIAHSLKLSGRELQIVRAVFDDYTDSAIAQQIGISLSTVHTHVERLHHKLAIVDRPQLLLRVMEEFVMLTVSPENKLAPLCAYRASRGCPFSA